MPAGRQFTGDALPRQFSPLIVWLMIVGQSWTMNAAPQPRLGTAVSEWKTFTSRAGWSIKRPVGWQVFSCAQCSDPTAPHVFVTLYDPATKTSIMIAPLIDQPKDKSLDQWLHDISSRTDLKGINRVVHEDWIQLDATRALKVIYRNADSTRSEYIYTVNGSQTFSLSMDPDSPTDALCRLILSTFRFKNSR